jgi:hypothetical protein
MECIESNSKRSHVLVEKRLHPPFSATLTAIFQRVDLLSESLPLPLPLFAGDDSSMHAQERHVNALQHGTRMVK